VTEPDPGREPWFVIVSGPVGKLAAVVAIAEVLSGIIRPLLDWIGDLFVP